VRPLPIPISRRYLPPKLGQTENQWVIAGDMKKPLLIIVSGPPCTGKTALGRRLAKQLSLPFINKDGIKESLFDTLGWKDRGWSQQLGRASSELLWYFAETQLAAAHSLIIESNFDPTFATSRLLALKATVDFEPFQVQCIAAGDILFQRFKARAESGERHPGHVDHLNYAEWQATLRLNRHDALEIGGSVIEIDTTDFQQIDYDSLITTVPLALAP
jgi:predicted kinase